MAKKNKISGTGSGTLTDPAAHGDMARLLDEIVQESLSTECNIIVLEGKIRDLEEGLGKGYVPYLARKIKRSSVTEQRVILDLLVRSKSNEVVKQLRNIAHDTFLSIKVRLHALTQLEEWDESIDGEIGVFLRAGKDVLNSIGKRAALGLALDEDSERSITERSRELPGDVRLALVRQILEDFPEQISLVLDLVQDESDLDESIIDMLAELESPEVANLFGKLLAESEDRATRRHLKKHVYRLKQKGFQVEIPRSREEDGPTVKSIIDSPQAEAYVSAIDYLGERLMFLSKSVVGWGVVFFQIALSDQDGIKTFDVFDLKRREIKNFLKRVEESGTLQLFKISPDYCHYLLEEAYHISLESRTPLPDQYGQWRAELNELKGNVVEPIVFSTISRESLEREDRSARRLAYGSLHDAGLFKGWFLEPRLLWEYIEKYKDAETSPLVLNKFQKEERKATIFSEATRNIFNDRYRQVYKRRLEEMAYILFREGDADTAKLALMAALDLEGDGVPSEQHGFLRRLVTKSIHFYVEGERERQQDNLLIAPR